jgi:iron complex transport system permease protein
MKKHAKTIIIALVVIIFLASLYLEVFCGHINLQISDIMGLFSKSEDLNTQLLSIIRLPKAVKAIIAGTGLAVSGMFLQTVTKNPLVEPYFTGVSSGAGLALVLAITAGLPPVYYSVAAFFGAILISLIVISLTGLRKFSLVKLILIGLSINIFVSAVVSSLTLLDSEHTRSIVMVLTGNISSSLLIMKPLVILFTLGMIICIFMVPKLNFLVLDGNIVTALSSRAHIYFIIIVILSSFMASLSVCAAGILGFVGIIIPHLSRLIIGQNFKLLFLMNVLLGSTIVLFCDYVSRTLLYPTELPLGLVISMIGAPIFIAFIVIRGSQFYA